MLIELALAIVAQHKTLATTSPLKGISGIENFETQVTLADTANRSARDFAQKSKQATETRDNALGPDMRTPGTVRYFVAAAREVLAGTNKGSEHVLGDWGFVVDASPQAKTKTAQAAQAKKAA